MRKLTIVLLLALSLVFIVSGQEGTLEEICEVATPADEPETREYDQAEYVLEPGIDYHAIFCTDAGAFYLNLFENQTPITVNNFVFLAENGYFNNTTFHRVIENFMAQGGDPTGTGTGGPGYRFEDEFPAFLTFDRDGLLAMANAGTGTNGSQFFITTEITNHLDYRHTIFGEVLAGQDNVMDISIRDPQSATEPGDTIHTIVIVTEPENVTVELESPEALTADDMQTTLDVIPDLDGLTTKETSGVYVDEAYTNTLPSEVQEDAQAFLDEYGYENTTILAHENTTCDLEAVPFESVGYTIHMFDTAENAVAAIGDDRFLDFVTGGNDAEPLENDRTINPIYTWEEQACEQDGVHGVMFKQIGRLVAITDSVRKVDDEITEDVWLPFVNAQLYESAFAQSLRDALSGA